jgi:hypothetical protein
MDCQEPLKSVKANIRKETIGSYFFSVVVLFIEIKRDYGNFLIT